MTTAPPTPDPASEHDQDSEPPLTTPPEVHDAHDGANPDATSGDQDAEPSQVNPDREGPTGTEES